MVCYLWGFAEDDVSGSLVVLFSLVWERDLRWSSFVICLLLLFVGVCLQLLRAHLR